MNYSKPKHSKNRNADLLRYSGLGMQLLASLALAVFAGLKADRWLKTSFPLLIWMLPLLVIIVLIYKLIRETSKSKETNAEK